MSAPDRMSSADYRKMMGVVPVTEGQAKAHARSKYGAQPQVIEGERFDSKLEARRFAVLQAREAAGEIAGLQRQVPYALTVNGVLVSTYRADFQYWDAKRYRTVVEDVKGGKATITDTFKMKARHMRAEHGIEISIVERAEA